MISSGNSSIFLKDILDYTTEANIISYYLGINSIPCIINSPIRQDLKPSFGIYTTDCKKIYYTDFACGDKGSIYKLLGIMWNKSYVEVLKKLYKDLPKFKNTININNTNIHSKCLVKSINKVKSDLQVKVRQWRDYDIEYWKEYGIDIKWLKYANVYPISHTIITKNDTRFVFSADKYAYVYVESKEDKITLKVYQPLNIKGYKWCNKNDSSVIGLWTKVPNYGDNICICSSLKDALCLWSNIGIPSIYIQGEAYSISNTAINELKRRYVNIYILLDNDKPGLEDSIKLSKDTGFTNIILPQFDEGKDISDLYKAKGNIEFKRIIKPLFGIK